VGEVSAEACECWRMVVPSAALLALPLTVAVHRIKKPCIYAGFNNLMTDGTQMGLKDHPFIFHFFTAKVNQIAQLDAGATKFVEQLGFVEGLIDGFRL
jgi:hypothetical protein